MFLVVVKSSLQDLVSDYRAWLTWAAPQVQLYKRKKTNFHYREVYIADNQYLDYLKYQFARGRISRRDFMGRVSAAGVTAAVATRVWTHYSHQMTAAARAIAAMKFLMLRSKRVAIRRQSLRRQTCAR